MVIKMLDIDFKQAPPTAEDIKGLSRLLYINKVVMALTFFMVVVVPFALAGYLEATPIKVLFLVIAVVGLCGGALAIFDLVVEKISWLPSFKFAGLRFYDNSDLKAASPSSEQLLKYCKSVPGLSNYVLSVRESGRAFVNAEVIAMNHMFDVHEREENDRKLDEILRKKSID